MSRDRAFVFSVRQLTAYVRTLLTQDRTLQDVAVRGEIGDCTRHSSGHVYCTLKDDHSRLQCVMFREAAQRLDFVPASGMQVTVRGELTVYEPRGQYQLIVYQMQQAGLGDLYLQFERLRNKLAAEGLFDEHRKRPVPKFPSRVAVLTSGDGAAVHDILTTLRSRWPAVEVVCVPTPVTGPGAEEGIRHSLDLLHALPGVEVAILARGGGSMEEMWCFNAESVARAIAASPVPVVTGIGHEVDFTIADFVADLRAPTPTAAAAAVTPDRRELLNRVHWFRRVASERLERRVSGYRRELALLRARPVLRNPRLLLLARSQRLDDALGDLSRAASARLAEGRGRLTRAQDKLSTLDPERVLARGYAVMRLPDGKVVRSSRQLVAGGRAEVLLHEGGAGVEVTEVREVPVE